MGEKHKQAVERQFARAVEHCGGYLARDGPRSSQKELSLSSPVAVRWLWRSPAVREPWRRPWRFLQVFRNHGLNVETHATRRRARSFRQWMSRGGVEPGDENYRII